MVLYFSHATGKSLYKACVTFFIPKFLDKTFKVDSSWHNVLTINVNVKPEWRSLYKPPLIIRAGYLQCRVLHGAVAVNAFKY